MLQLWNLGAHPGQLLHVCHVIDSYGQMRLLQALATMFWHRLTFNPSFGVPKGRLFGSPMRPLSPTSSEVVLSPATRWLIAGSLCVIGGGAPSCTPVLVKGTFCKKSENFFVIYILIIILRVTCNTNSLSIRSF